jgi:hypothetical protein
MLNFYDPNIMNITIDKKYIVCIRIRSEILSEKEKLFVFVSAVSIRIRSIFILAVLHPIFSLNSSLISRRDSHSASLPAYKYYMTFP